MNSAFYRSVLYPAAALFDAIVDNRHRPVRKGVRPWEEPIGQTREIAIMNVNGQMQRRVTLASATDLRRVLADQQTLRVDVGPWLLSKDKIPIDKELVFDIDATDFDAIRTCCEGKAVCDVCWSFVQSAAEQLQAFISARFGCTVRTMWVVSGGRGVHCWVKPVRPMRMDNAARAAIVADACSFFKHPDPVTMKKMEARFAAIAKQGGVLNTPKSIKACCKDDSMRQSATRMWDDHKDPARVAHLLATGTPTVVRERVCHVMAARIDANVSKDLNHLIRCPLTIHNGSGRLCLPFKFEDLEDTLPSRQPRSADAYMNDARAQRLLEQAAQVLAKFGC